LRVLRVLLEEEQQLLELAMQLVLVKQLALV
jgi:hypothetical protein